MAVKEKQAKPYEGFPLSSHPNGQWCKRIRGKLHYFGTEWQAALRLFQAQRDDLYAGRKPRTTGDGPTVAEALDQFLSAKDVRVQTGELSQRTYDQYVAICDRIAEVIDLGRLLSDIDRDDLDRLRGKLAEGKRGPRGITSLKGDLNRARMFFYFANENILDRPIRYRAALATPSRLQFRRAAMERGERLFAADQIRQMLKVEKSPHLRAMIYLAVNCGFGNTDCGTLPLDKLDLDRGWHFYHRPKTYQERRCPLWPETVAALEESLAKRPPDLTEATEGLVFVTKDSNPYTNRELDRDNAISLEFRRLTQHKQVNIYRRNVTTFYTLRRTFETIAAKTGEQVAVDHIMGHLGDDMASVYRQRVFDEPLLRVTNHVRDWLAE